MEDEIDNLRKEIEVLKEQKKSDREFIALLLEFQVKMAEQLCELASRIGSVPTVRTVPNTWQVSWSDQYKIDNKQSAPNYGDMNTSVRSSGNYCDTIKKMQENLTAFWSEEIRSAEIK